MSCYISALSIGLGCHVSMTDSFASQFDPEYNKYTSSNNITRFHINNFPTNHNLHINSSYKMLHP
ncbi:MAG: exported protein of unknown function [Nitrosopumilales archaeon]|nr:MAG: exported protein of unknown function [Nitrosopumilales archaeon]